MKAKVRQLKPEPGCRVLVVSDIHGNLPLFKGVLARAGFSEADILIVLGDILERSAGSIDTLRYVMELTEHYTVYPVLGNCDNVILSFADRGAEIPDHIFERMFRRWGERSVAVQMARAVGVPLRGPEDYPAAREAFREMFRPELEFLRSLPHILVNDDYLFVHGGVPREDRLEELDAYKVMKNDDFLGQGRSFRRWVIVGHWPVTLYREDIASADPIVLKDRHIVSIDGGCTLKLDGQLNALILPAEPGGEFAWVRYDGFPEKTARDPQAASPDPVNIRWGRSRLEVLERGEKLTRCRHLETDRVLEVLTEYLREDDKGTWCEDSTDYLLPVAPGDRLSVVRQLPDRALCKKDGVTGWYFGRLEG